MVLKSSTPCRTQTPSIQDISSTQGPQLFSTLSTPFQHQKPFSSTHLSRHHSVQQRKPSAQHKKPWRVSWTEEYVELSGVLKWRMCLTEGFRGWIVVFWWWTDGCVELRLFYAELTDFWSWKGETLLCWTDVWNWASVELRVKSKELI